MTFLMVFPFMKPFFAQVSRINKIRITLRVMKILNTFLAFRGFDGQDNRVSSKMLSIRSMKLSSLSLSSNYQSIIPKLFLIIGECPVNGIKGS